MTLSWSQDNILVCKGSLYTVDNAMSYISTHPTYNSEKLSACPTYVFCYSMLLTLWYNILQTVLLRAPHINTHLPSDSHRAVFTCRLSHVILQERTLILLHCPSTVNSCTRSTSFHSILAASQRNGGPLGFQPEKKNVARGSKKTSSEGRRNKGDPYHNFPSHLPGMRRDLRHLYLSLAWPTLPRSPPFSLTQTLPLHWCSLMWRVRATDVTLH